MLHFLLELPLSKLIDEFVITLLIEWKLFDVDYDFGECHCKT